MRIGQNDGESFFEYLQRAMHWLELCETCATLYALPDPNSVVELYELYHHYETDGVVSIYSLIEDSEDPRAAGAKIAEFITRHDLDGKGEFSLALACQ